MKEYFSEAVICHLIKFGSFFAIALLVFLMLDPRLPAKFSILSISSPSGTIEMSEKLAPSSPTSATYPEFEKRVRKIVDFVNDESLREMAFLLFNTSNSFPGRDMTAHQLCSALLSLKSTALQLKQCDLKVISETRQAMKKLHNLYIVDQIQWANDPLHLERYRLSRLGYDLTDVYQRERINEGTFTKADRDRFDLRTNGRNDDLKNFEVY